MLADPHPNEAHLRAVVAAIKPAVKKTKKEKKARLLARRKKEEKKARMLARHQSAPAAVIESDGEEVEWCNTLVLCAV